LDLRDGVGHLNLGVHPSHEPELVTLVHVDADTGPLPRHDLLVDFRDVHDLVLVLVQFFLLQVEGIEWEVLLQELLQISLLHLVVLHQVNLELHHGDQIEYFAQDVPKELESSQLSR
jgi:hypothetical protein